MPRFGYEWSVSLSVHDDVMDAVLEIPGVTPMPESECQFSMDVLELTRAREGGSHKYQAGRDTLLKYVEAALTLASYEAHLEVMDKAFVDVLTQSHTLVTSNNDIISDFGWELYQCAQTQRSGRTLSTSIANQKFSVKEMLYECAIRVAKDVLEGVSNNDDTTPF
jgi:hypothetical protein